MFDQAIAEFSVAYADQNERENEAVREFGCCRAAVRSLSSQRASARATRRRRCTSAGRSDRSGEKVAAPLTAPGAPGAWLGHRRLMATDGVAAHNAGSSVRCAS
jgi:hypothetical protein